MKIQSSFPICAIIPAYNEESTVADIISETLNHVDLIILMDDGSSDNTEDIVRSFRMPQLIYEKLPRNMGKGNALRQGIEIARTYSPEVYVFLDADKEHNPNDIPQLVLPILKGDFHASFGVRSTTHSTAILRKKTG